MLFATVASFTDAYLSINNGLEAVVFGIVTMIPFLLILWWTSPLPDNIFSRNVVWTISLFIAVVGVALYAFHLYGTLFIEARRETLMFHAIAPAVHLVLTLFLIFTGSLSELAVSWLQAKSLNKGRQRDK